MDAKENGSLQFFGVNTTKREAFAMAAMIGLTAYGNSKDHIPNADTPAIAVRMADALLIELAKVQS